jgi:DNA-binding HxlR family transcriptional regulator
MQHKALSDSQCPIARSLDRVGEWWSILILRDAFHGLTRFEQFQRSLGIAPNMLKRRLDTLVDAGLLRRSRYNDRPPRDEYVLTERGRDFHAVLVVMMAWGNRHFATEGVASLIVNAATGAVADPILVDRVSGEPIDEESFKFAAGPAAGDAVQRRMAFADRQREKAHGRVA